MKWVVAEKKSTYSIGLEAGIVGDHHLSPIAALKKLGCRGEHTSDLLLESCALPSSQLLIVNLDHMVVRLLLGVDAQLVVGVRLILNSIIFHITAVMAFTQLIIVGDLLGCPVIYISGNPLRRHIHIVDASKASSVDVVDLERP